MGDTLTISCPSCYTEFRASSHLFQGKGRKVRCSNCTHTWFYAASLNDLATPSSAQEVLDPVDYTYAPLEKKSKLLSVLLLAAVSVCIFFTLVFFARNTIVSLCPLCTSFYKVLHIPVGPLPQYFELQGTSWTKVLHNGVPSIIIRGNAANMAKHVQAVPLLRITLKGKGPCPNPDDQGLCLVDQWHLNVSNDQLLPGQVVPFSTSYPLDERFHVTHVYLDFERHR